MLFHGEFDSEETELNWTEMGDLSAIWPQCQELRRVHLRAGGMAIGPISLPKCESFEIETGGLDAESLAFICKAEWPELHTLDLWLGPEGTAESSLAETLHPLLAGSGVPKLRRLALKNTHAGTEVITLLAASRLLPQLEVLDVSMSDLDLDVLREHAAKLSHLQKLILGADDLEPDELPLTNVVWEDRYGPVYE
ncbi:MAG: hypothetical protein QM831_37105 [Kofleriaceae bacterium]